MSLIHPFSLGSFYGAIELIIYPTLIFMTIINMVKIHPFNLHPLKIKLINWNYQFGLNIHRVNIRFTHVNKKIPIHCIHLYGSFLSNLVKYIHVYETNLLGYGLVLFSMEVKHYSYVGKSKSKKEKKQYKIIKIL
jgi:hypothetical protein